LEKLVSAREEWAEQPLASLLLTASLSLILLHRSIPRYRTRAQTWQ